jgi:lipopolysaccharide export system protein LptA
MYGETMSVSNKSRMLLSVCALCAAASAWALKGDKNQPINIQSNHGDFQSESSTHRGTGIYTGHVIITQGSIRITADKAILRMINGEIQTADITGSPATFQQQLDNGALSHGIADEITYNAEKNEVILKGNAHVQQGERLLTGDLIQYNTDTEHVTANGGKTSGGRINITLPPQQSGKTQAPEKRHKHKKQKQPEPPPPQKVSGHNGPS